MGEEKVIIIDEKSGKIKLRATIRINKTVLIKNELFSDKKKTKY